MSVESLVQPDYKEINRNGWSLVYNPEFKEYRKKYENIISTIQKVLEGEKVEGVEIRKIKEYADKEYFLLQIDNEQFFIKKTANYNQGGVKEFKAGKDVEEKLKYYGLEKVRSIEYMFAYTDKKARYVVSRYEAAAEKTLSEHLAKLMVASKYAECTRLKNRFGEIRLHFPEYDDLSLINVGYDAETDEIILFDLNLKKDSLIESSDDEL